MFFVFYFTVQNVRIYAVVEKAKHQFVRINFIVIENVLLPNQVNQIKIQV